MTTEEHQPTEGTEVPVETTYEEREETTEKKTPRESWPSRISWSAVFAGTLVALVVMGVLNILGIAIGAVAIEAGAQEAGFGVGAGIWWTLTALVGLFLGGWTAGHFSDADVRSDGLMHGVVTWSLFTLATFLAVTTTIGQIIGGAFGFVGQNLTAALAMMQPEGTLEATLLQEGLEPAAAAEIQAALAAAGEQAVEALAVGAAWTFVALLLGVLVAAFAGSFGVIEPGESDKKRSERFASRFRTQPA